MFLDGPIQNQPMEAQCWFQSTSWSGPSQPISKTVAFGLCYLILIRWGKLSDFSAEMAWCNWLLQIALLSQMIWVYKERDKEREDQNSHLLGFQIPLSLSFSRVLSTEKSLFSLLVIPVFLSDSYCNLRCCSSELRVF